MRPRINTPTCITLSHNKHLKNDKTIQKKSPPVDTPPPTPSSRVTLKGKQHHRRGFFFYLGYTREMKDLSSSDNTVFESVENPFNVRKAGIW